MVTAERRTQRPPLLVLAFLAVFGLVAAVNTAYLAGRALLERSVRSARVTQGTLAEKTAGEGLLLRREAVLVAATPGLWQVQVERGQRVSAGARIGEILDPALLGRAQALQQEVETERAVWQGEMGARLSQVETELKEVTAAIQATLAAIRLELRRGAGAAVTERLQADLDKQVARRTALLAEQARLNEAAARGGTWRDKSLEADRLFRAASTPVTSPVAGVVFFTLDGWEEAFDPLQSQAALTLEEPRGTVLTTPVAAGDKVAAGQILAKVVQDEPTFLRVKTKEVPALDLKPGAKVEVSFTAGGLRVPASLEALQRGEGECTVLVKLENAPAVLAAQRAVPVEIVIRSLEGPLVPQKALVQQGNQTGVYLRRAGKWRFTPVDVKLCQNDHALVTGLKAGDEVAVGWRP
ncbi:MAG TPA: hypothetical protein GX511_01680 [Firmicutes bacterium]|nr:hypothetical protein [Bacillota bacterium]